MLGKFWDGVGSKLADRWAATGAPALIFWLGGLLAWAENRGGVGHLTSVSTWLTRQSTVAQLVAVLAALTLVGGSALIVERLTFPTLRLIEGYWPKVLNGRRRKIVSRIQRRAVAEGRAWQALAPHLLGAHPDATADQLGEFARLERRRRRLPNLAEAYMPTRTGNILRAAETWPRDKYGLDAVAVWPRLWLLMPDSARQELTAARGRLDSAVAAVLWGLFFCAWAVYTPLAVPIGLVVAAAALLFWIPDRAEVFGDLVEASYDLYRTALYQQLRWPLPVNPAQERDQGKSLTAHLWRGSDAATPTFTPPAGQDGKP